MTAACCLKHVGDQLGSDRCARFVLFVLSGVREARYHSCYSSGRGGTTGVYHDKEFHEVVVDAARTGLNNEHIFIPNGFACNYKLSGRIYRQ